MCLLLHYYSHLCRLESCKPESMLGWESNLLQPIPLWGFACLQLWPAERTLENRWVGVLQSRARSTSTTLLLQSSVPQQFALTPIVKLLNVTVCFYIGNEEQHSHCQNEMWYSMEMGSKPGWMLARRWQIIAIIVCDGSSIYSFVQNLSWCEKWRQTDTWGSKNDHF